MKYNWHIFFKRLTIVVSILIVPITIIVGIINDYRSSWEADEWGFYIASYATLGCLFSIVVWILYFLIRWVVRGLQK